MDIKIKQDIKLEDGDMVWVQSAWIVKNGELCPCLDVWRKVKYEVNEIVKEHNDAIVKVIKK